MTRVQFPDAELFRPQPPTHPPTHLPLLGLCACQPAEGRKNAETRDRTGDLQIFSLTLSQLSYRGLMMQQTLCTDLLSARLVLLARCVVVVPHCSARVSVAEWSKASDSSSDGANRVGSNPTADIEIFTRSARFPRRQYGNCLVFSGRDTVAEWLRRRPAKPMCSARVGSNPIGVAFSF